MQPCIILLFAADRELEEPKEALVQQEGISGECEHCCENDDAVVDHRFLVRPDDLFQLKLEILEPLGNPAALGRFLVLRCLFFLFGGSDLLVLRHRFVPFCSGQQDAAERRSGFLLGFLMQRMLVAVSAVLHHFDSVGVILLVLLGNIVSLLAFCASQSDFNSHIGTS